MNLNQPRAQHRRSASRVAVQESLRRRRDRVHFKPHFSCRPFSHHNAHNSLPRVTPPPRLRNYEPVSAEQRRHHPTTTNCRHHRHHLTTVIRSGASGSSSSRFTTCRSWCRWCSAVPNAGASCGWTSSKAPTSQLVPRPLPPPPHPLVSIGSLPWSH